MTRIGRAYVRLSFPITAFFLFANRRFDPAYRMTWARKIRLAVRIYRNWRQVPTGVSYKAHLAMAAKLLEISPSVPGVVVECGCWLGGSSASLSLVCAIVERDLIIYDSFEGLPPTEERIDNQLLGITRPGMWQGDLDVVRENIRKHGVIDSCQFRKGWFSETLPDHREPIVLCFLDVDLKSSLHDCVVNLWPHLTDHGYMFVDDYVVLDHCALFFSESFWRDHFDRVPPGLIGSGTGIGVGQFCIDLWPNTLPAHEPTSLGYARKDLRAHWDYEPDIQPAE